MLSYFREKLPFHDIPIKLYMRSRSQSDAPSHGGRSAESSDSEEASSSQWPFKSPEPRHDSMMFRQFDREVNEALAELED